MAARSIDVEMKGNSRDDNTTRMQPTVPGRPLPLPRAPSERQTSAYDVFASKLPQTPPRKSGHAKSASDASPTRPFSPRTEAVRQRANELMELGSPGRRKWSQTPPPKSRPLPQPAPLTENMRHENRAGRHSRTRSLPTVPGMPSMSTLPALSGLRQSYAPPSPSAPPVPPKTPPRSMAEQATSPRRMTGPRATSPPAQQLKDLPDVPRALVRPVPRVPGRADDMHAHDTSGSLSGPMQPDAPPPVPHASVPRRSASPLRRTGGPRSPSPVPRSPSPAALPGMPPIPIITIDGAPIEDDWLDSTVGPADTSPVTVSIGGSGSGPFQAESQGATPAVRDGIDSVCAGCRRWIGGRLVHAMNTTWHPRCFLCTHCSTPLEHVSFYEHDGRPYCHLDFHEIFSRRCYSCKTPIVEERYVTVDDHRLGGQRTYHELHFFCASCGEPFIEPKDHDVDIDADDDEHRASSGADGGVRLGGRPFFIHGKHPYCGPCHERLLLVRCKACKEPIREDAVRALGADWHPDCFVCTRCRRPFGHGAFFIGPDGSPCDFDCYQAWLKHTRR